MATRKINRQKAEALEAAGALNKKPNKVVDELFQGDDFFDPHDLVQVKYEMLRRVKQDQWSVTAAAEHYGFSRFAFYQAHEHFENAGLAGFLPKKKGPQRAHKLTDEILEFISQVVEEQHAGPEQLAVLIKARFDVEVHPRSIGRAIVRWKKKP